MAQINQYSILLSSGSLSVGDGISGYNLGINFASARAIADQNGVLTVIGAKLDGSYVSYTSSDTFAVESTSSQAAYDAMAAQGTDIVDDSPVDPNAGSGSGSGDPNADPNAGSGGGSTPAVNPLTVIPVGSTVAPADADGSLVPTMTGLDLRNGLLTGLPWADRADQAVPLKQLTQALNLANTAIEAKIDAPEVAAIVEAYGYQTAPQVSSSIATAIAAIDFGNRRASVPAKYYYAGTVAQAQALLDAGTITLGVSTGDDLDTPDVIASLMIIEDTATGAFTLLQNQGTGLVPVNDLFFLNDGNIGSAFFIRENIAGQTEYAGKAFVVTNANSGTATIEAVIDPNRQMNSAGDAIAIDVNGEIDVLVDTAAIVIDGQNRLTLAQSVKDAIAKIPGMETAIAALESAIVRIDGTLSSLQTQVTALAARMLTAEGAIVALGSRTTALETAKTAIVERLNGLFNSAYEILLEASGPKYRNASDVLVSASDFVTLVSETDNYATYSIAHGLNQRIIPAQYWFSNAAGAMLEQFTAARVTSQTANAYNVTIRKSDSVLVQIPVTPKVLAALTV